MKLFFCLLLSSLFFFGCSEKSAEEIAVEDQAEIEQYLIDNGLTSQVTDSGLHFIVEREGNGSKPDINNEVTVHYHGYFPNGEVFDSSVDRGEPSTFQLSRVILGWIEGIPKFSKGGKGVLLIPSALAYGPSGRGSIPGNAVLIFDVELIDIN